jgi:hypothetical protein
VAGDVENVTGPFNSATDLKLTLIGNAGPNVLDAETLNGIAEIAGGGGDDVLRADYTDDDSLFAGGEGDDEINGSSSKDIADGGAGNDEVNGFGGDDSLFGGPGLDVLNGSSGSDTLVVDDDGTDGDRANCDLGADVAKLDAGDFTDELCEVIERKTRPPAPGPQPDDNTGAGAKAVIDLAVKKKMSLTKFLRGIAAAGDRAGTFKSKLTMKRADAKKLGIVAKRVKFGTGKATLKKSGFTQIKPKLTRKAKRALKRMPKGRKVKVKISTIFTPVSGPKVTTKDVVTLKK